MPKLPCLPFRGRHRDSGLVSPHSSPTSTEEVGGFLRQPGVRSEQIDTALTALNEIRSGGKRTLRFPTSYVKEEMYDDENPFAGALARGCKRSPARTVDHQRFSTDAPGWHADLKSGRVCGE